MKNASRLLIFASFGLMVVLSAGLSGLVFAQFSDPQKPPPAWLVPGYMASLVVIGAILAFGLWMALGRFSMAHTKRSFLGEAACKRLVYVET